TWQADYMTGIPGGYWSGKFVAVGDPEPPPETPGQSRPVGRKGGDRILTPAVAGRRALEGLKRYGLFERESWKRVLGNADPGEPVLVQRLDHLDRFYYIVPMQRSQRRVGAFVSVDARYGTYNQALAVPEQSAEPHPNLSRDQVLKRAADRPLE